MTRVKVARDDLNDVMELDHVIRVYPDGRLDSNGGYAAGIYAPDVSNVDGPVPDDGVDVEVMDNRPWRVQVNRSNQWNYKGAVMHPSEFIGGGMADDILTMPGYWVAVEVRNDDGSLPDGDSIGWALLWLPIEEEAS